MALSERYKKALQTVGEANASPVSVSKSKLSNRYQNAVDTKTIGFDTLNNDIDTLSKRVSDLQTTFLSTADRDTLKSDVTKMSNRLNTLKKYNTNNGYDNTDVDKLIASYQNIIDNFDSISTNYSSILNNSDYKEKSVYNGKRNIADYLLGADQIKRVNATDFEKSFDRIDDTINSKVIYREDQMDDNEKGIYNYLYNVYGKDEAEKYYSNIERTLMARKNQNYAKDLKSDNVLGNVGYSLASVPLNLVGGVAQATEGTANAITSAVKGNGFSKGWNDYAMSNDFSNSASAMRQNVTNNLDTNVGKFLYQTGMSTLDSVVGAVTGEALILTALGGASAQNTTVEMLNKGATEREACMMGIVSGLIETATEKISQDSIRKILGKAPLPKGLSKDTYVKQVVSDVIKQAKEEGREEFISEVLGNVAEGIILDGIDKGGTQSTFLDYYDTAKESGFSNATSVVHALGKIGIDSALAYLGGALSGGVMGGALGVANTKGFTYKGEQVATDKIENLKAQLNLQGETKLAEGLNNNPSKATVGMAQAVVESTARENKDMDSLVNAISNYTSKEVGLEAINNYAEDMEGEKAELYKSGYDGNLNPDIYDTTFNMIYNIGYKAESEKGALEVGKHLDSSNVLKIYKLGFEQGIADHNEAEKNNPVRVANRGTGVDDSVISYDGRDTTKTDYTSLNEKEKMNVLLGNVYATLTKTNVVLFDSSKTKQFYDGQVVGNKTYFDIRSEKDSFSLISHEFVHLSKNLAYDKYATLQSVVLGRLAELKGITVDRLILEEMVTQGSFEENKNLTEEQLRQLSAEELTARACEDMFSNSKNFGEDLEKMSPETRKTFYDQIKQAFTDVINAIKKALGKFESTSEEAKLLRSNMEYFNEVLEKFEDAYESVKNSDVVSETTEEGKFARKGVYDFSTELDNWDKLSDAQKKKQGGFFYVMETGSVLRQLGLPKYQIKLGKIKTYEILSKHPEITLDTIKSIPDILNNPICVVQSLTRTDSIVVYGDVLGANNVPVMVSLVIHPNDYTGNVEDCGIITSEYARNNSGSIQEMLDNQVYYLTNNKNRASKWAVALRVQFPSALTNGSVTRIPYAHKIVNRKDIRKLNKKYLDAVNNNNDAMVDKVLKKYAEAKGYNTVAYHGTDNLFNAFDWNKADILGTNHELGYGFYLGSSKKIADKHGSNVIETRIRLEHPYYNYKLTITKAELSNLIDIFGINVVKNSGYSSKKDFVKAELNTLNNDTDIINHLFTASGINDVKKIQSVYKAIKNTTGRDGAIGKTTNNPNEMIYLVYSPEQIKSLNSKTYDDNNQLIELKNRYDSGNKDMRYSRKDSNGATLTDEQIEYFKNSAVRDELGNLLVMYHNSKNSPFTIFNQNGSVGIWGSPNMNYSRQYTGFRTSNEENSELANEIYNSEYYREYKLYFNIKNPLNLGGISRRFSDVMAHEYSDAIGIDNIDDWHTLYDLMKEYEKKDAYLWEVTASKEFQDLVKKYGFDGLMAYEGDNVTYCAFDSEQVKLTTNKKPTSNPDIRFSRKTGVEETKDLLAVHNMHEEELIKTLELGGFPMPSIAIMKSENANANKQYGPFSIVFDKNAIDPKNKDNKVYGGDAWTPRFPRIYASVNDKKASELYSKMIDLERKGGVGLENSVNFHPDNLEDSLTNKGLEKIIEDYKNSDSMKQMFLAETDNQIKEYPKKTVTHEASEVDMLKYNGALSVIPNDVLLSGYEARRDYVKEHVEEIKKAIADSLSKKWGEKKANLLVGKLETPRVVQLVDRAYDGMVHGFNVTEESVDKEKFSSMINERVDQKAYEKWLNNLFDGIEGRKGIRNNKDTFTSSGNRRSWTQLYDEVNLDNIVKAMRSEQAKGEGIFGWGNPLASATYEFKDIEDIKNKKDSLNKIPEEEYKKIHDNLVERFNGIAKRFNKRTDFGALVDTGRDLSEIVSRSTTKSMLDKNLKAESQWYNYSKEIVDDLWDLMQDIQKMPTGYFEAKPRRAVNFDEIAYIVAPNTINPDLLKTLESKGIEVRQYSEGDDDNRLEQLNAEPSARFSRKDSEGKTLTAEQVEFYKNSAIRDLNGNLLRLYHGTSNTFTVFDTSRSGKKNGAVLGRGIYLTDNKNDAFDWGGGSRVVESYVNITKPLYADEKLDNTIAEHLNEIFPVSIFEDYTRYDGVKVTAKESQKKTIDELLSGKNGTFIHEVMVKYGDGNGYNYDKSTDLLIEYGYDGIVKKHGRDLEVVAFESNQVKEVTNLNPTSNPDIRYSLKEVRPVEPTSNSWKRGVTTAEAMKIYPKLWNVKADESEKRNPTQVVNTESTYNSIYEMLKSEGFIGKILDASSGLGLGTKSGRKNYGFDVDDIEPYPSEDYKPKYKDYSRLNKKYDAIISNAVLNVLPQDQRDALVVKMGELLNEGGRIFINVRSLKEIQDLQKKVDSKTGKLKNIYISDSEVAETSKGSYQKGFTKTELISYLQDALGDGFVVYPTTKFGKISAIVEKKNIRYSRKGNETAESVTLKEDIADTLNSLKKDKLNADNVVKEEHLKYFFTDLFKEVSIRDNEYKEELIQKTAEFLKDIHTYSVDEIDEWLTSMAKDIQNRSNAYDKSAEEENKAIIKQMRNTAFSLNEAQIKEIESATGKKIFQSLFGKVKYDANAPKLESQWANYWSVEYPHLFKSDISDAEMGVKFLEILDDLAHPTLTKVFDERTTDYLKAKLFDSVFSIRTNPEFVKVAIQENERRKAQKKIDALREEIKKGAKKQDELEAQIEKNEITRKANEQKIKELLAQVQANTESIEAYESAVNSKFAQQIEIYKQKYNESQMKKIVTDRIVKKSLKLKKYAKGQMKDAHTFDVIREPLLSLLDALDFNEIYYAEDEIGFHKYTPERLAREFSGLADVLAKVNDSDKNLENYFDVTTEQIDYIRQLAKSIESKVDLVTQDGTIKLKDLNSEELTAVYDVLNTIDKAMRESDNALASLNRERISSRVAKSMDTLSRLENDKATNSTWKKLRRFLSWDNLNPVYAFSRLGKGGEETFKGIQDAVDKFAFNSNTIVNFTKEVTQGINVDELRNDIKEITVNNKTFKMTVPQIMELYCLSKRPQAQQHLYKTFRNGKELFGQGMVINDINKEQNSSDVGVIKLEKADVDRITNMLTKDQKEIADKLQNFMSTTCSDWGNYVTMKRWGTMAFTEQYYYPIDPYNTREQNPHDTHESAKLFRLLNQSFTKALNDSAVNPIKIGDIFNTFLKHSTDMAKYNAFALATLDTYKYLSYIDVDRDEQGNYVDSRAFKTELERVFGSDAERYIVTFLEDLNGEHAQKTTGESFAVKMMGKYKASTVALNIRVAMMQPMSIMRTLNVMDKKYLLSGIKPSQLKKSIEEMNSKSGIALWKNVLEFYDINVSRKIEDLALEGSRNKLQTAYDKAMKYSMKMASNMDEMTWGFIWTAVNNEIKDKHPKAEGETFDKLVNDRFREIIYKTQVVDSVATRSTFMRSNNTFAKMLTSFASEPTLSYSMVSDEFYKILLEGRGSKTAMFNSFKRNKDKVMRALAVYILTTVATNLVASLPDVIRDNNDDDSFIEQYVKNFLNNVFTDATGMLPIVRDISSTVINGYDPQRMDEAWMLSLRKAIQTVFNGEFNYNDIFYPLKALSQTTGIPISNGVRDIVALWDKTIGNIYPSLKIRK